MTQEAIRARWKEIEVKFAKFKTLADQLDETKRGLEEIFQQQYGQELAVLRASCTHENKKPDAAKEFTVCPDCGLMWIIIP